MLVTVLGPVLVSVLVTVLGPVLVSVLVTVLGPVLHVVSVLVTVLGPVLVSVLVTVLGPGQVNVLVFVHATVLARALVGTQASVPCSRACVIVPAHSIGTMVPSQAPVLEPAQAHELSLLKLLC